MSVKVRSLEVIEISELDEAGEVLTKTVFPVQDSGDVLWIVVGDAQIKASYQPVEDARSDALKDLTDEVRRRIEAGAGEAGA